MAWTEGVEISFGGSKTANQASIAANVSNTATAGQLLVAVIALDNNDTADGDEGAVTSITDPGSNTWVKAIEFTNAQGSAQTGATCSVWYAECVTGYSSGTITINLSNSASRDATGWQFKCFTKGAGATVSVAGTASLATAGADPGAITLGSLSSSEYLWIWGLAAEGPDTDAYTLDADYTTMLNGAGARGTTGGGAASNMHVRGASRIFTGTTDTVDVTSTTADRDYAQVLIAFKETATGTNPVWLRVGGVRGMRAGQNQNFGRTW